MPSKYVMISLLVLVFLGSIVETMTYGYSSIDHNTVTQSHTYLYQGSFRIIYSGKPLVPVLLGLTSPKGFEISLKYKLLVGPLSEELTHSVKVSLVNISLVKIIGIPKALMNKMISDLYNETYYGSRLSIPLILQLTNITGTMKIKLVSKPFIWPEWVTKPNATVIAYYKNVYCIETRYSYIIRRDNIIEKFIYASYQDMLSGTPLYEYYMYYQKDNENNTNLLVESEVEIVSDYPDFGAHYSEGIIIEYEKPKFIGKISLLSSKPFNTTVEHHDDRIEFYLKTSYVSPLRIVVETENISGNRPIPPHYDIIIYLRNGTSINVEYCYRIVSSNYYVLISKPLSMGEVEHITLLAHLNNTKIKIVRNLDLTFIIHKHTTATTTLQIILVNIALVVAIVLVAYLITLLIEKI